MSPRRCAFSFLNCLFLSDLVRAMVWGRLVVVQDVEDAREGRVEEGGEGAAEKRGPEQDGEEFSHWWKTSTLPDSFAFVKHLSANTL